MPKLSNNKRLKKLRRKLRNNSTSAEACLWSKLKGKKLGAKFRRQHSFGNYILDFYCPEFNLAIELDGSVHENDTIYREDKIREQFLADKGIEIIRFENRLIFENLEWVLEEIRRKLKE